MKIPAIQPCYLNDSLIRQPLNKTAFTMTTKEIDIAETAPAFVVQLSDVNANVQENEEDSYLQLLQKQRCFVPHLNLLYLACQNHVRQVVNTSTLFTFRTRHTLDEMFKRWFKSKKQRSASSAFIAIGNMAEE